MNSLRNKVQLIGNLGADPEVRTLENGTKVANFSLATNESYNNDKGDKVQNTQWHNVVAWGKVAEIIEKYVKKGSEIAVDGKLQTRNYQSKDSVKTYVTEVVVNEVLLLGTKD